MMDGAGGDDDEWVDQEHVAGSTSEALIVAVARQLTAIRLDQGGRADQTSWNLATTYVTAFRRIEAAIRVETGAKPKTHQVNSRILSCPDYDGPRGRWLTHAKRTGEVFSDLFEESGAGTTFLSYDEYRQIAVCSLRPEVKQGLRHWAEKERPHRAELRRKIREAVDGRPSPDFDLKVTNLWRFCRKSEDKSEFDGGIHPDLVANLLYYFTDPGGVVLDPMAGGDTTHKVLQKFEFFHAVHPQIPFSGPRMLLRADLEPIHDHILRADVREIDRYVTPGSIDFCLLDPPYWKIALGKYDTFGSTIEDWQGNLRQALEAISRVLKPSGTVAVVVDDYLRSKDPQPLAFFVGVAAVAAGYSHRTTIYNAYPNALLTMGPAEMDRCKRARLLVSECKVIQVFEKNRKKKETA